MTKGWPSLIYSTSSGRNAEIQNEMTESIRRFHKTLTMNQAIQGDEFLVSKETVVLRRWERLKQKFGFIKRVDKG